MLENLKMLKRKNKTIATVSVAAAKELVVQIPQKQKETNNEETTTKIASEKQKPEVKPVVDIKKPQAKPVQPKTEAAVQPISHDKKITEIEIRSPFRI